MAADQAWGLGYGLARLGPIAERLGSDVPFFLHAILARCGLTAGHPPGAALCSGRGEKVQPIGASAGLPCVVVKPTFGLSTPAVYAESRTEDFGNGRGGAERLARLLEGQTEHGITRREQLRRSMGNALQAAAERLEPRLIKIREWFDRLPVVAHQLSGSGSAYFAICRTHRQAIRIASVLRGRGIGQAYAVATG